MWCCQFIMWPLIILSILQRICSGCLIEEKRALLDFKAYFNLPKDDHHVLPSWIDDQEEQYNNHSANDCCNWEKITCSNTTGRIVELHLNRILIKSCQTYRNQYRYPRPLANMSIFLPMQNLQKLYLSHDFAASDAFKGCEYADWFGAPEIAGCEHADKFENLEYLIMDWNKFDDRIIPCVTAIPSLKNLSLSGGNFTEEWFPAEEFSGLKPLEYLDLSYAQFSGSLSFKAIPYLKYLSLAGSDFTEGLLHTEEFSHLKELEYLDLSDVTFSGSLSFKELKLQNLKVLNLNGLQINELSLIVTMTSLTALSLSNMRLNGSTILEGICSLKNLVELDLSYNQFSGSIPLCFSYLTSLKVLDISNNNFSGSIPPLIITNLVRLEYLSLSDNQFEGSFSFALFAEHSKLQILDLSHIGSELYIDFNGLDLPPPLQLRVFNLAGCNLKNEWGHVLNFLLYQSELRFLDLSSNRLVGRIPLWLLENNTFLEVLILRNNSFMGPFFLDVTSKLNLFWLDISKNEIVGQVPRDIGILLPKLGYLNLSSNSLEGSIPESLGNLTRAMYIDLSNNNFFGGVPNRIGTGCPHLEILILSHNNLQGLLFSFMNLTSLQVLYMDNNNFSGSIIDGLSQSSFLQFLDISNNKFEGKIPSWIGNLSSLLTLDLSHNQLEGTIPDDICKLESLSFLDLSENQLIGSIPSCSGLSTLRSIHLQKNLITGSIPDALLESSIQMITLDLGYNYLSGSIPHEIGTLAQLRVLLLGGNQLHGHIPVEICHLKYLTILDLSHNRFSGQIPICLGNISFGREQLDYDQFYNDGISIIFSVGLQTFEYNASLSLHDFGTNDFAISDVQEEVAFTTKSRTDTFAGNILNYLSGIDLSCNQLTGEMPLAIANLIDLRALNLSHNHLQGSIPSTLSMLNLMESLDLSYNNFSGQIPTQLNNMSSLGTFNVSYNNLSGVIPETRQFGTFDESSYRGNPNLCGPLLKKSCNSITTDVMHATEGEETDGAIDMVAFLWSFSAGFVAVLSALALSLYISPQCCGTWFGFIDVWILSRFYHRFKFHSKLP